jgi:uncharacterized protein YdeI (YjbR/CyaY-like superfamily)
VGASLPWLTGVRLYIRLMPAQFQQVFVQVEVQSRAELRQWLEAHHAQTASVWLVTWKKSHPGHVPYSEVVDEALCFGWVDSLPRKLDAERTMLLLSPRKARSSWSKVNKEKAERLIREGRMHAAGLAKISEGKRGGGWDRLNDVDALIVPDDLAAALKAHPPAQTQWASFPKSARRGILEWIQQARRSETRAKRIAETATRAARGERANAWRPKDAT